MCLLGKVYFFILYVSTRVSSSHCKYSRSLPPWHASVSTSQTLHKHNYYRLVSQVVHSVGVFNILLKLIVISDRYISE